MVDAINASKADSSMMTNAISAPKKRNTTLTVNATNALRKDLSSL